ncbi:SdrD B-like domain-containing protein [Oscillatoria sp. FACHB-1406]|uniref:SdrD B-like domain-containing protein n=1 Tax=Oscillatoria sp. FACHB-1406 TaxID=2692846 RepID=UPI0016889FD9|nr:SdrD B-like domain-containing protein [Oscillatoria sp. FACHB-1406]MBD2578050.1 hypothetical protein [Oscillatoria sp. FACHB-1406]
MSDASFGDNLIDPLVDPLLGDLSESIPTVTTDKLDYAPGETVTITASGFDPGSSIQFSLADDPNDPGDDGDADIYTPFTVTDGSEGDLDGQVDGKVVTTWTVPTDNNSTGSGTPDALNATLNLTAIGTGADGTLGTADDQVATTTFTDGNPSLTLNQWETTTDQWANGQANSNQATYLEGDVVPFSLEASNLTVGTTYGIRINLNTYQSNTDAGGFLYLDTYNRSITPLPDNFSHTGTLGTPTVDSTFTFTDPSYANPGLQFYVANADVLSVTYSLSPDGLNRYADVRFKANAANENDGEATAEIYWGQRLALPNEVVTTANTGGSLGASGFTGGSLQTKVEGTGAAGTTWVTPSNAVQLMPGVVQQGAISGYKWNDLNANGVKDANELGLAGWTINLYKDNGNNVFDAGDTLVTTRVTSNGTTDANDDGLINSADLGFYKFAPIVRGTYFVTETQQSGWTQTFPNNNLWGPLTIDENTPQRTNINFGNFKNISLSGYKWNDIDGDGVWDSNETGLANWTIQLDKNNDGTIDATTTTDSTGKYTFTNLGPGTYKVTEQNQAGWTQTFGTAGYTFTAISGTNLAGTSGTATTYNFGNTITNLAPAINIEKTVNPTSISEGSTGPVTYTYVLTNTDPTPSDIDPLTIQNLVDDNGTSGNAADDFDLVKNGVLQPGVTLNKTGGDQDNFLEVGETWTYQITRNLPAQNAGTSLTNIAKVSAVDDEGTAATDTDDATVTYNNADPAIKVVKTASTNVVTEGTPTDITYIYKLTNESSTSTDPLTILNINDDQLGDLSAEYVSGDDGDNLLEKGETWIYQATATGVVLNADEELTNVVTVSAEDDEGTPTSDTDTQTVTGENADPAIKVVKTASTNVVTEGTPTDITYTYKLTNESSTSTDPLTILNINDDQLGDLSAEYVSGDDGDNLLEKGETWIYQATATGVVLNADEELTNVVTVSAEDDEGTPTSDTDTQTVTGENADPAIKVVKTGPDTVLVGGASVTYNFTITADPTNVSTDPIEITSLTDDKLGNLLSAAQTAWLNAGNTLQDINGDGKMGIVLNPNQSFNFNYTTTLNLSQGQTHTNVVTVKGVDDENTLVQDDDPHSIKAVAPKIDVEKLVSVDGGLTFVDADNPSGPNLNQGTNPIFKFVVTNTGDVPLSNITLSDSNFDLNGNAPGTTINIASLAANDGQTGGQDEYVFTFTAPWQSGQHTNTATVSANYTDSAGNTVNLSDSDNANYFGTANVGQITPTGVNVNQYINGTAPDFSDYYASQGGVIQYNTNKGKINNTNPGVFFYYTGLSNAIKGFDGPDAGTAPDPMTIYVNQSNNGLDVVGGASNPGNVEWNFGVTTSDVKLFKVTDVNNSKTIDAGDTATQVQLQSSQIVLGIGANKGDVTVNFTPDAVGSLYVLSVQYNTGSVVGLPQGNFPTVNYSFNTDVGNNGTIEETDTKGITLKYKFATPLTLDGTPTAGGSVLTKAQLEPIVSAAIDYWAQQGVDAKSLKQLEKTDIIIGDLGGSLLGESVRDGLIVKLDDDAAGYGWSESLDAVNPDRVDLLSALTHEFGHILGYDHSDMGEALGVGERHLPLDAHDPLNTQPLLGLDADKVLAVPAIAVP